MWWNYSCGRKQRVDYEILQIYLCAVHKQKIPRSNGELASLTSFRVKCMQFRKVQVYLELSFAKARQTLVECQYFKAQQNTSVVSVKGNCRLGI